MPPAGKSSSSSSVKKRRKRQRPNETFNRCLHCESTKHAMWCSGPDGRRTLCGACFARYYNCTLPLYCTPAGAVSVLPVPGSIPVRHYSFRDATNGDRFLHPVINSVADAPPPTIPTPTPQTPRSAKREAAPARVGGILAATTAAAAGSSSSRRRCSDTLQAASQARARVKQEAVEAAGVAVTSMAGRAGRIKPEPELQAVQPTRVAPRKEVTAEQGTAQATTARVLDKHQRMTSGVYFRVMASAVAGPARRRTTGQNGAASQKAPNGSAGPAQHSKGRISGDSGAQTQGAGSGEVSKTRKRLAGQECAQAGSHKRRRTRSPGRQTGLDKAHAKPVVQGIVGGLFRVGGVVGLQTGAQAGGAGYIVGKAGAGAGQAAAMVSAQKAPARATPAPKPRAQQPPARGPPRERLPVRKMVTQKPSAPKPQGPTAIAPQGQRTSVPKAAGQRSVAPKPSFHGTSAPKAPGPRTTPAKRPSPRPYASANDENWARPVVGSGAARRAGRRSVEPSGAAERQREPVRRSSVETEVIARSGGVSSTRQRSPSGKRGGEARARESGSAEVRSSSSGRERQRMVSVKATCIARDGKRLARRYTVCDHVYYSEFFGELQDIFGMRGRMIVSYKDEDGDDVAVTSNNELSEMFAVARRYNIEPLRIQVRCASE